MVPPRIPQFNWIDLGLPSGTLWLDRKVGAPAPDAAGLYYQWGSIVGHAESEMYDFSEANYVAQGLNLIDSDLNDNQDAARAYYGPAAKMPTSEQALELFNYTTIQRVGTKCIFTSIVNGRVLVLYTGGYIRDSSKHGVTQLNSWLLTIAQKTMTVTADSEHSLTNLTRSYGINIMAVHS